MSTAVAANIVLVGLPEPRLEALSPEGFWHGERTLTGDASGGTASCLLDVSGEDAGPFVFTIDAIGADCSTGDGGEGLVTYRMYVSDTETERLISYRLIGSHNTAHGRRYPANEMAPPRILIGNELGGGAFTMMDFNWQTNVNTLGYAFTAWGRYYRRHLVRDPAFLEKVFR